MEAKGHFLEAERKKLEAKRFKLEAESHFLEAKEKKLEAEPLKAEICHDNKYCKSFGIPYMVWKLIEKLKKLIKS